MKPSNFVDSTGKRFGRLTALKSVGHNKQGNALWLCRCDCGKKIIAVGIYLRDNRYKSCGCQKIEKAIENIDKYNKDAKNLPAELRPNFKHGFRKTRFYNTWTHLKGRCNNHNKPDYKHYGGRGIKCLWKNFTEFKNDMYDSYIDHVKKFGIKNTTIDRIDNSKNYCKNNCRWSNWFEQANNKRSNHLIKYKGQIKTMSEWSKILNINYFSLANRLNKYNWSIKKSFETPIQ